jgi:hypothetical protein
LPPPIVPTTPPTRRKLWHQQRRIPLCTQLLDDRVGELPCIPADSRDQLGPDALECLDRILIAPADARRQHRRNVFGQAPGQLLQHALLGHRSRDRLALEGKIVIEAGDDLLRNQAQLFESLVQIEQVTVPAPPQQCAQLRAEQFLRVFPVSAGALNRSHRARQMIRSCSTCRRSGQGAFVLHACRKAVGITLRSPPLH